MTNLETLANTKNKFDLLLVAYIIANGGVELVNKNNRFNRGDFYEITTTKTTLNNSGLHGISKGDFILNGQPIELKYCTIKTSPSMPLVGTICEYTIIAFNNGHTIEERKIKSSELECDTYNHITFKLNHTKGELLRVFTIK